MTATVLNTGVDARVSLNGLGWCFAKVLSESITETIRNEEIICAHVDPEVEGDAVGREINKYIIHLDPDTPMLESLLPKMGLTLTTGVYYSDISLSSMAMVIDYGATAHSFAEAWITRVIIRGGTSTVPVSMELHIVAGEESDAGADPSITDGDIDYIYGFPGSVLTAGGTVYTFDRFVFAMDRQLVFDYNSSNFITGVGRGKRNAIIATSTPYLAANKSVYWSNKTKIDGLAVSVLLTNGIDNITIAMPKSRPMVKSPSILRPDEITRVPLTFEGRRQVSGGTSSFTVTIAAVP